ncbi:MAG: T9SS type A sorting domain-containing protein [Bacteroidales bacterium]|nr:T9SS type A sorting domain-containing protein [Bacteroidales bacterium]
MKKLTLLSVLMFAVFIAVCQSPVNKQAMKLNIRKFYDKQYSFIKEKTYFNEAQPLIKQTKKIKAISPFSVEKTKISTSFNLFTAIVNNSNCLTAKPELNLIMFTHRSNPLDSLGTEETGGNIVSSFSTDGGSTWKSLIVTGENKKNRYPSGAIYNPAGNTDPLQAYSVVTGPTTDGDTWVENYFGSAKLDSSDFYTTYVTKSSSLLSFPRYGLTTTDDGLAHVLGYSYYDDLTEDIIWKNGVMNNGKFDNVTKNFNWERVPIKQSFAHDSLGLVFWDLNTAWSKDGKVGYVYFIGADSLYNYATYQPIVFKSVDSGKVWEKLPVYDFSTLTDLTDNLWAVYQPDTNIPPKGVPLFFPGDHDAVVDSEGNLHIFAKIMSNFFEKYDTIGYYIFKKEPIKIFEVFTKSDNTWGAQLIDTIQTKAVTEDSSPFPSDDAADWGHRIQASVSADGNKIFAIWSDTDTLNTGMYTNVLPNIKGYAKDIKTGKRANVKDFTANTEYDGDNYWHYASDMAIKDTKDNMDAWVIPVTTSKHGSAASKPVTHYYLHGVYFTETDFVDNFSIKENANNILNVQQNYPNPFSDFSYVNINLSKPAKVSLEVRNILGPKVMETKAKNYPQGNHNLFIDGSNLKPGLYLYTVKTAQYSVTKKMLVK